MKRIIFYLLLIVLLIPSNVKGLTFEEVATKYQEKYDWSVVKDTQEYEFLKEFEEQAQAIISNNNIKVTYEGDISYYTLFTYDNGIISYNTNLSEADLEQGNYDYLTIIKSMFDNMAIVKMIYIVAELNGYTINDLINYASDIENRKMTMDQNGLEIIDFEYTPDNPDEISISGVKTFKIDINKLNFEGKKEEAKPEEIKEQSDSSIKKETPQNILLAYYILAGLIIAIIILSICLVILNKRNK